MMSTGYFDPYHQEKTINIRDWVLLLIVMFFIAWMIFG